MKLLTAFDKKTNSSSVALLLLLPILLIAGSPAWGASLKDLGARLGLAKSEFLVRESGYWTCEGVLAHCVYWLDNDRIIFNGSKPGEFETTTDGRRVSKHAIYIWDLKNDTVKKYVDADKSGFCFSNGYIRYNSRQESYLVVRAGQLSKESEVHRVRTQDGSISNAGERTRMNPFTCRTFIQSELSSLPGTKVPLKEGDGFLYLGTRDSPSDRQAPVIYFPNGSKSGIKLPIARWQLASLSVTASDFRNSYVLTGDQLPHSSDRCVPKNFSRTYFRLTMPGTVEAVTLPSYEEIRCHVEVRGIHETRAGTLVYVNSGNIDTSGLYLIRQTGIVEVLKGWVLSTRTSPDGCRLAGGISSKGDARRPTTAPSYRGHLKVIDLCEKGAS